MSKIYPQDISGKHRSIKNYSNILLLILYFCGSWIRWNRGENAPDQAILIDLPARRGYFFGLEIWPEEILYITGILIMAALGLFLFTSLFGRLWCGYTCPQTVFVDIFLKIESFFQGDRNARIKLDSKHMDGNKFTKKLFTHICWLGVSFAVAFGWVCYFYNVPQLIHDLLNSKLGVASISWLLGLTASTYLFAGFFREKVCTYFCPYGRFQSAMLDNDTLLVTYNDWRGEARAGSSIDAAGDCIDCGKCVFVCPTGIDIRNGMQMECIGCGLCVDACNSVMEKIGKPLNLISYDSINNSKLKQQGKNVKSKFIRKKTVMYTLVLATTTIFLLKAIATKSNCTLNIEKENNPLFTKTPDGGIRNAYKIKIHNKKLTKENFCITVEGVQGALYKIQNVTNNYVDNYCFDCDADSEIEFKFFVKSTKSDITKFEEDIIFYIKSSNGKILTSKKSIFINRLN